MGVDLDTYRSRIGYGGKFEPTVAALKALHLAHATRIPFENLDVLLGRPIRLDLENLWAKLVTGGRGGYCFEHNAVFAAVLKASGFRVRRLAARVRYGTSGIRPRLHMLLLVEAEGEPWLADVGFGADGLVEPIPFCTDREAPQFAWRYRLVSEPPNYVLESWTREGWIDLYAFGMEEHYQADYEVANYYTSTYPGSHFRRRLTAQLPGTERRVMLVDRMLSEHTPEGVVETPVADEEALLGVLADRFGLVFPSGTRFPLDGEPRL